MEVLVHLLLMQIGGLLLKLQRPGELLTVDILVYHILRAVDSNNFSTYHGKVRSISGGITQRSRKYPEVKGSRSP